MSARPQRHYSLDDYFAVEQMSGPRHEYHRGEIFAMAGASLVHNRITLNVLTALRNALRDTRCEAFGSDLRIATPAGLYTYPDVSVLCRPVRLEPGRPDSATNPVLLAEVLSDATRDYDRGEKFALYKSIATLRAYVLIDDRQRQVELFTRSSSAWRQAVAAANDEITLTSIGVRLPLAEIYRNVRLARPRRRPRPASSPR